MSGVLNLESAMAVLAGARRETPDGRGCGKTGQQAQAAQLVRWLNEGDRRPGMEASACRRNATSGLNRCPLKRSGMSRLDSHSVRATRIKLIEIFRSSIFAGASSCSMVDLQDIHWQRIAASAKVNPREWNPCR